MEIKTYGYIRVKTNSSDVQIEYIKQHLQDERDLFIDIETASHSSTEQYTLLKRILRKDNHLYISSLSDLGHNKTAILQEWINLTKNIGISVFLLDLLPLQKNANQHIFHEVIFHLLNWLATEEESDSPFSLPHKTNTKFPKEFIYAYTAWKAGEISSLTAMRICNVTNSHFFQLIKQYESL